MPLILPPFVPCSVCLSVCLLHTHSVSLAQLQSFRVQCTQDLTSAASLGSPQDHLRLVNSLEGLTELTVPPMVTVSFRERMQAGISQRKRRSSRVPERAQSPFPVSPAHRVRTGDSQHRCVTMYSEDGHRGALVSLTADTLNR